MISSNETIEHYNNFAGRITNRYESADVGELQKVLCTTFMNCNSILELGCGSGRDAAFLHNDSPEKVFSITDGSEAMLDTARKLHPELSSFLKRLELPEDLSTLDETFDGIYSVAALMHLTEKDVTNSLKLIAGLLEPGGILFISVCTRREKSEPEEKRHFTFRNSKWWYSQIEKSGLQLTSIAETSDALRRNNTIWLNLTAVKQEY